MASSRQGRLIEDVEKMIDFIKTEVNGQPTDRSIQHFKTQIVSYIIPLAKQKLKSFSKGNAKGYADEIGQ